jgi:phosphopantothenoylcysteine decarboxylase/phosphopantothenate--cysteine ligase
VSLPRAAGIEYLDVQTAAELAAACDARFDACDVLIMAAAVADYRPEDAHAGKLKKDATGGELNLRLVRTTDVLSMLAERRRPGQVLVGFAAEHGEGALEYGREKLTRKKLDAVIVNDVSGAGIGFDASDNEVWIVTADEERHVPKASKGRVAGAILDAVLSRRSSNDIKVRR